MDYKPSGHDARERYEQEIDSNVMRVRFNMLKESGEVASGDPVFCKDCGVIFNKFSQLLNSDGKKEDEPGQALKEELKEEVKEEVKIQGGGPLPPLMEGE